MTSDQAFLQAIIAEPGNDEPRLVYADWLEDPDGGQSAVLTDKTRKTNADRAEFIRAQVGLARLEMGLPRYCVLHARAEKLLHQHREEWLQPLRAILPELKDQDVAFTRGFPSKVLLRSFKALPDASQLADAAPLQEIYLDLRYNGIGDTGAQALAQSPHLARLTHLNLRYNLIGDAGGRALLRSLRSGTLNDRTKLLLEGNAIDPVIRTEIELELGRRREQAEGKARGGTGRGV